MRLYQLEEEFFHFKESIVETANPQDKARLISSEAKLEELSNKLARFEDLMECGFNIRINNVRM